MKIKQILIGSIFASVLLLVSGFYTLSTNHVKTLESEVPMNDSITLSLMNNNCFTCHNPDLNAESRVAPPLFKIREHYLDDKISKKDFIAQILKYVNNPSEANSVMPGAVRNFGLMPKMIFNNEDVKKIAAYLYDVDISSDAWYQMWDKIKDKLATVKTNKSLQEIGLDNAMRTKAVLGKNLLAAIQEKGTENAIIFCNSKAIPLTDSMSSLLGAKIKRVTNQPRNSNNQANTQELAIIKKMEQQILNNEKIIPQSTESKHKFTGYYPIETGKMCMQCHGDPTKDIAPKTLQAILKLYPQDKAIGYKENQLRGIWVVEIAKNNK